MGLWAWLKKKFFTFEQETVEEPDDGLDWGEPEVVEDAPPEESKDSDDIVSYTTGELNADTEDLPSETKIEELTKETEDETFEINKVYLQNLDWDNLTLENIQDMENMDLDKHSRDYVRWYKISKFKGLPDSFIKRYKANIIWKEYNKSYLKKAIKQMLKDEGYI